MEGMVVESGDASDPIPWGANDARTTRSGSALMESNRGRYSGEKMNAMACSTAAAIIAFRTLR